MKNEVGDKSPNEAATEWLIAGEALALDFKDSSTALGMTGSLRSQRRKKKEKRRMVVAKRSFAIYNSTF